MTRYAVSLRVCVTATLLAVVGFVVLFTAVVITWRSVLDSCSTSALVSLDPVSPPSFFFSSLSSLPSPFSISFIGRVEHGFFFDAVPSFLGSVPSPVAQGILSLPRIALNGPTLGICCLCSDFPFCDSSHTYLHSSLAQLADHYLHPFLPREPQGYYISFLLFLFAIIFLAFKLWLYYVVIPSLKDLPLDEEESWLVPGLHHKLASVRTKLYASLGSFWQHRLRPSTLFVSYLHHSWISMMSLASFNIVVGHHYLCFKPDLGITHCHDYSSFSRSLTAVWRAPLAWYSLFGLATLGMLGYVIYWHLLIYLVVRAYFLRRSGKFSKAGYHATLDGSVELGHDVSFDAYDADLEGISFDAYDVDLEDESFETGLIVDAVLSGNDTTPLSEVAATPADGTAPLDGGPSTGVVLGDSDDTDDESFQADNTEVIPSDDDALPGDAVLLVSDDPNVGVVSGESDDLNDNSFEADHIEDIHSGDDAAPLSDKVAPLADNPDTVLDDADSSAVNPGPQFDDWDDVEAAQPIDPSSADYEDSEVEALPSDVSLSESRRDTGNDTETADSLSDDANTSGDEQLEQHESEDLVPPPALPTVHLADARSYSHRFPQGYQLSSGFLKNFELTSTELGVDDSGFRLKARCRETGNWVSAKFFPPENEKSLWVAHGDMGTYPHEILVCADISHHNIADTLFVSRDEFGWAYMVQEMGISLVDFIATPGYKRRQVDMARHIFAQIVDAVDYLDQKGLAHNDLRLGNIFVTELAEVKLVGFHQAKLSVGDDLSQLFYASCDYCGEELHAPPEALLEAGHYASSPADIWSLGIVLSELLLGHAPFSSKDQILQTTEDNGFLTEAWSADDVQLLDIAGVSLLLRECCLVPNPVDRTTIEVLKAHPWLKRADVLHLESPFVPSLTVRDVNLSPVQFNTTPTATFRIDTPSLNSQSSAVINARRQFREHFSRDVTFNPDFLRTYQPGCILGAGGFGCVIKARHRIQGHDVAFKFISKSQIPPVGWTEDDDGEPLPLEVKLMKMAVHENIAKSLDVFQDNDFFYVGVELHGSHWSIPTDQEDEGGCSLLDYVSARGTPSEDHARYIFGQLVEAVHYLRSIGISHGDIKLENALIDNTLKVKLIDFGNAVLDDLSLPIRHQLHKAENYGGTPEYMPPECFLDRMVYYPPADVWSLGILLVQMLTGSLPFLEQEDILLMNWRFERESAVELWRELSEEAQHLIDKTCVVREIEDRATIEGVRGHPWLVGWRIVGEMMEVVKELKTA